MSIHLCPEIDSSLFFRTRLNKADSRPAVEGLPRELREVVASIHRSLFEQGLSVKVIKSRCRIRDNNVSSRFRYALGKGIKEYIDAHRMEAAGWLLCHTGLTAFEVAMEVGYKHVETFYQVFNRYFGCTPGEYRDARLPAGKDSQTKTPEETRRRVVIV